MPNHKRSPQTDDVDITLRISAVNLTALKDGVSAVQMHLVEIEPGVFALKGAVPSALPRPIDPVELDEVDDLFLGGDNENLRNETA
jgi:hypothetical protein